MKLYIFALLLLHLTCLTVSYQQIDQGRGFLYKLVAVKDTFLERRGVSYDRHSIKQLLVGKHPGFPLKRTLIQFENFPIHKLVNFSFDLFIYLIFVFNIIHNALFL